MTCASAWMESALASPDGGQRWVIYDEAWRLVRQPALLGRMQSQWKLSRGLGIANLMIIHRLSDLDAVGDSGSEARALAHGLSLTARRRSSTCRRRARPRRPQRFLASPAPSAPSCRTCNREKGSGASATAHSSSGTWPLPPSLPHCTQVPGCGWKCRHSIDIRQPRTELDDSLLAYRATRQDSRIVRANGATANPRSLLRDTFSGCRTLAVSECVPASFRPLGSGRVHTPSPLVTTRRPCSRNTRAETTSL